MKTFLAILMMMPFISVWWASVEFKKDPVKYENQFGTLWLACFLTVSVIISFIAGIIWLLK